MRPCPRISFRDEGGATGRTAGWSKTTGTEKAGRDRMDGGERRWAYVCSYSVLVAQCTCVHKSGGPPHRTISAGEDFCYRQGFHAHTGLLPGWVKGVRSRGHAAAPCNRGCAALQLLRMLGSRSPAANPASARACSQRAPCPRRSIILEASSSMHALTLWGGQDTLHKKKTTTRRRLCPLQCHVPVTVAPIIAHSGSGLGCKMVPAESPPCCRWQL